MEKTRTIVPNRSQPVDQSLCLFTDLYELTMLQAYVEAAMDATATFSLFVRRLPRQRNYLLACGLDDVLNYLENLRFDQDSLDYLASLGRFHDRFLKWLRDYRFTGDVHAVPEGTPVFANEPILEITAPICQAQLVETFVINQIHLQTTLASKAARVVFAARGRPVIDFGARRMHGTDAAIKAARAFYIAGVGATSNVVAGKLYGVPVTGTMAHSYVQAWENEKESFRSFVRLYPGTVLLVDTYDTLQGVARVCELAREMGRDFNVQAVRLDSGDLAALAFEARRLLDDAGLSAVGIFASSSLDEYAIKEIVDQQAPIDAFGVGTKMGVSEDAPSLDIAYKLASYAGEGRLKLSTGKPILPGRKQVYRVEEHGSVSHDVIARADEEGPGRPLLHLVMKNGQRQAEGCESLHDVRERALREMSLLPDHVQALASADPPYLVEVSPGLDAYRQTVIDRLRR